MKGWYDGNGSSETVTAFEKLHAYEEDASVLGEHAACRERYRFCSGPGTEFPDRMRSRDGGVVFCFLVSLASFGVGFASTRYRLGVDA